MSNIAIAEDRDTTGIGYKWTHTISFYYGLMELQGIKKTKVERIDQMLGYEVYVITMKAEGSIGGSHQGTWEMSRTLYQRTSDKALVFEEYYLMRTYLEDNEYVNDVLETKTTYDPPLNTNGRLSDPIPTWTVSSNSTIERTTIHDGTKTTQTWTETVEYTYTYKGNKTRWVEAGVFTCKEFEIRGPPPGFYSIVCVDPEIGVVKSENFEPDGTLLSRIELKSYDFSGEEDARIDTTWIWLLGLILIIIVIRVVVVYIRSRERTDQEKKEPPEPLS